MATLEFDKQIKEKEVTLDEVFEKLPPFGPKIKEEAIEDLRIAEEQIRNGETYSWEEYQAISKYVIN